MESVYVPKKIILNLSQVNLAPYNPRTITPEEQARLSKSLKEYGYVDLMVWNRRTNNIVGGNQRFIVLRDIFKWEKAEFIEVDMDLIREKALNIALNKISGDWDNLKLIDLINELQSVNFDPETYGFSDHELQVILSASEKFDPNVEWKGMPEYNSEDKAGRIIAVHFPTDEDVQKFAKMIGQKITPKTRYVWFPPQPSGASPNLKYVPSGEAK